MTDRQYGPGLYGLLFIEYAKTVRSLLPHLTAAGLDVIADDLQHGERWQHLSEPFIELRVQLREEVAAAAAQRVVDLDDRRARSPRLQQPDPRPDSPPTP